MENTPTVCTDHLPTILGIFKNDPKSRSVNIFSSGRILTQTVYKILFTSQSSTQESKEEGVEARDSAGRRGI